MAGSGFGTILRMTTWGESHGAGIGVVIDGCPAGLELTEEYIQTWLDRRKPGGRAYSTPRQEADQAKILSGVFEGKTTGTPISIMIENTSQRSGDYGNLAYTYRPGHADYCFDAKYGFRDYRGGGRSYGDKSKWRSVGYQKPQPQPRQDYFGDGDAISPFEKKPEPKQEEKPLDNGITDWKVGDRLNHKKFGDGTVIEIVSDKIFIVNFDTQGKKTLLSSHPMITRLHSKGGIA